jgi:hypothetical protein
MRTDVMVSASAGNSVVLNEFDTGETMEHPKDCNDCRKWAEAYEAATIAFFRLQNQFYIASFCCDSSALGKLAAEIDQVAARRLVLKAAAQNHRALARGQFAGL